jgi:hypothetical protein
MLHYNITGVHAGMAAVRAFSNAPLILLAWLAPVIHLCTLMAAAPASGTGLVFTFLLPGIAQAYWIWAKWASLGTLSHPLTLMCAAWIALLGIWIVARYMIVSERAPQPS